MAPDPHDVHRLSIDASHPCTRERFARLFQCAQHRSSTEAAATLNIHPQTMLKWLHRCNEHGPDVLTFARSGGRALLLTARRKRGSKRSFE